MQQEKEYKGGECESWHIEKIKVKKQDKCKSKSSFHHIIKQNPS